MVAMSLQSCGATGAGALFASGACLYKSFNALHAATKDPQNISNSDRSYFQRGVRAIVGEESKLSHVASCIGEAALWAIPAFICGGYASVALDSEGMYWPDNPLRDFVDLTCENYTIPPSSGRSSNSENSFSTGSTNSSASNNSTESFYERLATAVWDNAVLPTALTLKQNLSTIAICGTLYYPLHKRVSQNSDKISQLSTTVLTELKDTMKGLKTATEDNAHTLQEILNRLSPGSVRPASVASDGSTTSYQMVSQAANLAQGAPDLTSLMHSLPDGDAHGSGDELES